MVTRTVVSETMVAANIIELENAIIQKYTDMIFIKLNQITKYMMVYGLNTEKMGKWPIKAEAVFNENSALRVFRNYLPKTLEDIGYDEEISRMFSIKGVDIKPSNKLGTASGKYIPKYNRIVYKYETVVRMETSLWRKILTKLRKPTRIDSLEKWQNDAEEIIESAIKSLSISEEFNKFVQVLLHELVHASQNNKLPVDFDRGIRKNSIGVKFRDHGRDPVTGRKSKIDYLTSYHEIDAFANQMAAEIIKRSPKFNNIQAAFDNYVVPIKRHYEDILRRSKLTNNPRRARGLHDAWKRLIRNLVKNLQNYMDSRDNV